MIVPQTNSEQSYSIQCLTGPAIFKIVLSKKEWCFTESVISALDKIQIACLKSICETVTWHMLLHL